jgi:hypothetical protein
LKKAIKKIRIFFIAFFVISCGQSSHQSKFIIYSKNASDVQYNLYYKTNNETWFEDKYSKKIDVNKSNVLKNIDFNFNFIPTQYRLDIDCIEDKNNIFTFENIIIKVNEKDKIVIKKNDFEIFFIPNEHIKKIENGVYEIESRTDAYFYPSEKQEVLIVKAITNL